MATRSRIIPFPEKRFSPAVSLSPQQERTGDMLTGPNLYLTAALLYTAQARDAFAHPHPGLIYLGLAAVHFAIAVKKTLHG